MLVILKNILEYFTTVWNFIKTKWNSYLIWARTPKPEAKIFYFQLQEFKRAFKKRTKYLFVLHVKIHQKAFDKYMKILIKPFLSVYDYFKKLSEPKLFKPEKTILPYFVIILYLITLILICGFFVCLHILFLYLRDLLYRFMKKSLQFGKILIWFLKKKTIFFSKKLIIFIIAIVTSKPFDKGVFGNTFLRYFNFYVISVFRKCYFWWIGFLTPTWIKNSVFHNELNPLLFTIQYNQFIFLSIFTNRKYFVIFLTHFIKNINCSDNWFNPKLINELNLAFFHKFVTHKYLNQSIIYKTFSFNELKHFYSKYKQISNCNLFNMNTHQTELTIYPVFFENYYFYKFILSNKTYAINFLLNGCLDNFFFKTVFTRVVSFNKNFTILLYYTTYTNLIFNLGLNLSTQIPVVSQNFFNKSLNSQLLDQLQINRATRWISLYESYLTNFLTKTSFYPQLKKFWDQQIRYKFSDKFMYSYDFLMERKNFYPVRVYSNFKKFMNFYWPTRINPNNFYKFHDLLSNDNFLIMFLRKNKIFNKSRYSRNRQLYRTGVYICLFINVLFVYGYIFSFYRFAFSFSYLWIGIGVFIISMTLARAMKYRFYKPSYFFNEVDNFRTWLGFLFKELLGLVKTSLWLLYEALVTRKFWYIYFKFTWSLKRILKKKNVRRLEAAKEEAFREKLKKKFFTDAEDIGNLSTALPYSYYTYWNNIRADVFQTYLNPSAKPVKEQYKKFYSTKKVNQILNKYQTLWWENFE